MSKSTWGDVKKGDVVEINGREWRVAKIKRKKKTARVRLEGKRGDTADGEPRLKSRVKISKPAAKADPLFDSSGTARRWATKGEAREVGAALKAGDAAAVKPPAKAKGDPWERPADRIERKLDELLQARLVGISTDEDAGYYVPPVDVSTVASHLALFHGGIGMSDDESAMLAAHAAAHAEALKGVPLAVNHWHTAKRPEIPS